MTPDLYSLTKSVVSDYMATLTLDECREYILEKGLFNRNTKLKKGENFNVGLELLPSDLSGTNLCLGAGECKYSCIAFAGKGNLLQYKRIFEGGLPSPLVSKCKRTKLFLEDRKLFDEIMEVEITRYTMLAKVNGSQVAFRLNVTSDVDWDYMMKKFPKIQFYSYTKILNRKALPNHHITYSASEKTSEKTIRKLISEGKNVAMVFRHVPTSWNGIPVISGDDTDNRYEDASGVIVGLKYKFSMGKNMEDNSFVFSA